MWLPVMDNRNKAVPNPTSRDISDARMRCLVKAIAMHGLGAYIYAGEDLPAPTTITPEQIKKIEDLIDQTATDRSAFYNYMNATNSSEIAAKDFRKAMIALEKKQEKMNES